MRGMKAVGLVGVLALGALWPRSQARVYRGGRSSPARSQRDGLEDIVTTTPGVRPITTTGPRARARYLTVKAAAWTPASPCAMST